MSATSILPLIEEPYVYHLLSLRKFYSILSLRLTSVLTSRFLINLQQVKHQIAGSSRSLSQISDLAFQEDATGTANVDGFVGFLGAQLSFEGDDSEGEAEDVLQEEHRAVL